MIMPEPYRAVAEAQRVKNPQAEFAKLVEINGGELPTQERWLGWLKRADKISEAESKSEPAKPWEPPADWAEAIAYDPRREIAAKESAAIEAMLERMSPSFPRRSNESVAGDASSPLCVCAPRAAMGFGGPCLACSSGAA